MKNLASGEVDETPSNTNTILFKFSFFRTIKCVMWRSRGDKENHKMNPAFALNYKRNPVMRHSYKKREVSVVNLSKNLEWHIIQ